MEFKEFQEIVIERAGDIYRGLDIDDDTQQNLYDWFRYRECCAEDDKFIHFWHRNLKMNYPKYMLLLENELVELPDLTNYADAVHSVLQLRGDITHTNNGTDVAARTGNEKYDKVGTDTTVLDATNETNRTGTETSVTDSDTTSTNTGTDTTANTGTTKVDQTKDSMHADVSLVGPQSASYPGNTAGQMPNLDWSYISAQNQSKDNSGESTTTDNTQSQTTHNTQNKTEVDSTDTLTLATKDKTDTDSTSTTTYDTLNTHTLNLEDRNTHNSTNKIDNNVDTINDAMKSGRTETEVEIRAKVWSYVSDSFALKWLLSKMEICFMGLE